MKHIYLINKHAHSMPDTTSFRSCGFGYSLFSIPSPYVHRKYKDMSLKSQISHSQQDIFIKERKPSYIQNNTKNNSNFTRLYIKDKAI